MRVSSYPKVYAIGHAAISELFFDEVVVEEKLDGSQFSMMRVGGEFMCRSKSRQVTTDAPPQMFIEGVEACKNLPLHDNWIYRCEYIRQRKHNTLFYGRIPKHFMVLFDVETSLQKFLSPGDKVKEASRLGLEVAPLLAQGNFSGFKAIQHLLDTESFLGGCPIEGFVVKNYARFGKDKKFLVGKFVSERFKEAHSKARRNKNPSGKDYVEQLIDTFRTEARWEKAIQHLRDRGELLGEPKDIGALVREVQADTIDECLEDIKGFLWSRVSKDFRSGIVRGFPEWYKTKISKGEIEVK